MTSKMVRSTSFKKGQIGNPNGRPKGSYSPLRKQLMELKNKAAEKIEEAFEDLWRDFKAGDPLAKQIYFKELVSIPKEWLSEVSLENVPRKIKTTQDITDCSLAIIEKLLEDDTISKQEALELLKTFNTIKTNEAISEQVNSLKSREDYLQKLDLIQKLLDEKNK
jgi:hypothetical protein